MNSTNFHCDDVDYAYNNHDLDDRDNCAYARVMFQDTEYYVQISRPRHPAEIGKQLEEGADMHTDDGHDDNVNLYKAVQKAGLEWDEVVSEIVSRSDAENELNRIQAA